MAIPRVIISHISCLAGLLFFVGFTAALNAPSNFASSSSHNVSATLSWIGSDLLSGANKTAAESTVESNSRQDVRVPATNSNGDYVTTIVGEYSEPFVYSSAFTSNGVVISGQATSFRVEWTYTEVEASHYGPVKTVESSTTAQIWDRSPFIVHGNDLPGYVPSSKNAAWFSFTSFGREPACTAAYSAFIATGPFNTKILTSVTSSTLPNGQTAVGIVYSTDIWAPDRADACCGYCTLIFQTLQMLYWPGPHPQTICPTTSGSMANHESAWSTRSPGEEGNGLNDQPVYATGSDGYIFTSPSVYIDFPLVYGTDGCGTISPTTSLTLAFAPGELSTMLYYGAPPDDPYGMYAVSSRVLDTNDLPCGPLNKSGNWDVQDDDLDTDYQPLVQLPPKLLHLVPAWSSCHGNAFQGQDPPRTLSPATVLAPIRTTVHANPLPTPAAPGPPIRPLPVKTGSGAAQSLDPSQTTNPNNIAGPTADPAEATTSNAEQVVGNEPGASDGPASPKVADPPNFDPINPKAPLPTRSLAVVVQGLTITNNAALITVGGKTIAYQSGFVRVNNEVQQYPAAEKQNIANPSPVTVGGLTFSAIMPVARSNGESKDGAKASVYGMGSNALPDSDPGPNTYITVGGHTIAVQANGIAVAGETLRPGDPGITIDGTRISLGSSEFIVGDRTEIFSPPAAVTAQPTHITVNGEPISVGSDLIVVGGTTMKPGESGIIVHGKPVSLAASELVVGGVTESLTLAGVTPIPESSYTTLNGEIITIGTDVAVVGGNTLKPGGPGITIYGKLVSLGPSSIVVGGVTARLALLGATTTAAPSYITVNGETIAIGAGDVVVGGSTLKAGSPGITIDGKLVSLGSSDIVVGSVTEALGLSGSLGKTSSSYFTFDGETVAVGAGSVVVDGKTLTPGGSPVTVDGTMMSLGSSVLVVGSQTTQISLPAAPTTSGSGDGIGAMIMSGLGGMGGGTIPSPGNDVGLNGSENSNGIVPFMGKAAKGFGPVNRWCAWLVSLVALVLCA